MANQAGRRNVRNSMGNFTSSGRVLQSQNEIQTLVAPVDPDRTVELHHPAGDAMKFRVMRSLLAMIATEADDYQMNAYVASYIHLYLPCMGDAASEAFLEMGITTEHVRSDEAREQGGMVIGEPINDPDAMVYLGQLILLMLKSVSKNMHLRIKALCAICGADLRNINIVMNLERAMRVKAVLGSSHNYKKRLTLTILRTSTAATKMGQFSSYLATILEYTEMAPLVFIYETILLTRSPVIRIRLQVINLAKAFELVNACEQPKYFGLIAPPNQTRMAERSRYEILANLAQIIKAEQTNTVDNFVATRDRDDPNLARLKLVHDQYMATLTRTHMAAGASER